MLRFASHKICEVGFKICTLDSDYRVILVYSVFYHFTSISRNI